jgi:hypothetical protein
MMTFVFGLHRFISSWISGTFLHWWLWVENHICDIVFVQYSKEYSLMLPISMTSEYKLFLNDNSQQLEMAFSRPIRFELGQVALQI